MDDNKLTPGPVLTPLLCFVLTSIMAIILLVAALIMWLSELIGSATFSTLIVGGLFTFVAWLIYVLSIKRCIDYIRDRLDTIYDVAFAVRNGYNVALRFFSSFLGEILRK
ncbi:MAG: hypothetical protein IKV77_11130 [Alistipes sp.]|jgi:uncharacterized membrane protein YgaE (UPF0421/DUF939 family)|nr:hypothetical protein [Alistipes sp.]